MTWSRYEGPARLHVDDPTLAIYPEGEGKFLEIAREDVIGDVREVIIHTNRTAGRLAFELSNPDGGWAQHVNADGKITLNGPLQAAGIDPAVIEEALHVPLERDAETGFWVADVLDQIEGVPDEAADTKLDEQDYACTEDGCTFTSDSERGLNIHRARAHSEDDDEPVNCPDCGQSFDSETALRGHVNNPHTGCSWVDDESDDTPTPEPEPDKDDTRDDEPEHTDEDNLYPTDRVMAIVGDHDGRVSQETIIEETGWSRGKASGVITQLIENDRLSRMPAGDNGQTFVVDPDSVSDPEADLTVERNGDVDLSKYGPTGVTITPEMVIEALSGSQSIHQVERDLRIPRGEVEALLGELGVLEHIKDGTAKVSRQRAHDIVSGAVS